LKTARYNAGGFDLENPCQTGAKLHTVCEILYLLLNLSNSNYYPS
jgi:hypothetical protein